MKPPAVPKGPTDKQRQILRVLRSVPGSQIEDAMLNTWLVAGDGREEKLLPATMKALLGRGWIELAHRTTIGGYLIYRISAAGREALG